MAVWLEAYCLNAYPHAVTGALTNGSCPQGETCDYDQAQTGVSNTYTYDNNGNQTTRTINGVTFTLSYDAEGRLVSVNGPSINVTFTYDGDSKRVKSEINGVTMYFVGNYYEKQGNTITKYYFAGSQRVAMREGGTLYYLLADHLGSTSLTTDAGGNVVSEMRYSAWGSVRYQAGSSPSEYTFTGQYGYDFGLMFFNARWLDVSISHFVQADTLVPSAGQSQAWDRYAYANNSPIRFLDPTGHYSCENRTGYQCRIAAKKWAEANEPPPPELRFVKGDMEWTEEEMALARQAIENHPWAAKYSGVIIVLFRYGLYPDPTVDVAGDTFQPVNNGKKLGEHLYWMRVYDFAWLAVPQGKAARSPSSVYFEGTIFHEATHVACGVDKALCAEYASLVGTDSYKTFPISTSYSKANWTPEEDLALSMAMLWYGDANARVHFTGGPGQACFLIICWSRTYPRAPRWDWIADNTGQ